MPSMDEVLRDFPDQAFLINVTSNDRAAGERLASVLNDLSAEQRTTFMIYSGDEPITAVRAAFPDVRTMSRDSLKACLIRYVGYGWTGAVPDVCRSMMIFVPIKVVPWLWGWPDRFLNRMESAGSEVFVVGPYHGGDFSTGIDSTEDMNRLPGGYSGGVLTNELR